ncbi:unnamed protein product, partial [Polarella glacialis]
MRNVQRCPVHLTAYSSCNVMEAGRFTGLIVIFRCSTPGFGVTPEEVRESLVELQNIAHSRGKHWAELESWKAAGGQVAEVLVTSWAAQAAGIASPPASSQSALITHFTPSSQEAAIEAEPFADLLACFAERQGMKFVHDKEPHLEFPWARWRKDGFLLDSYLLGVEAAGSAGLPSPPNASRHLAAFLEPTTSASPTGVGVAGLTGIPIPKAKFAGLFMQRPEQLEKLFESIGRRAEWRRLQANLGVVNGPPVRWAKVWSIEASLKEHEAVVFLDYDVTVRPDCLGAARLMHELFRPSPENVVPHIVVRDAPLGIDCMNSGFVALRRTPLTDVFLKLWKAKLRWPGIIHGDQGALAETILEMLDLEHRLTRSIQEGISLAETTGYDHRCIAFLFSLANGMHSWRSYCDCYQYYLQVLTGGPFRNRTSGLVRFIDPRKIDVNFVPQQEYGGGDLKRLQRMRLLPLDLDNRWQHAASGAGRQPLTTMPRP